MTNTKQLNRKFKIINIIKKTSSTDSKKNTLLQLNFSTFNKVKFNQLKYDLRAFSNYYNLISKTQNIQHNQVNKITVLKSPHVYKRAREQFVSQLYQFNFTVYKSTQIINYSNLLKYIQLILNYIKKLPGFSIKLTITL